MSVESQPAPPPVPANNFWTRPSKNLEELATRHGVKPWTAETIAEMRELANELWPTDEDVNEFIAWVRELRHEGGQSRELP
jgi:hypothetical protein